MLARYQSLVKVNYIIASIILLLCGVGCFGPPMVQLYAKERLREEHVSEDLIQKINNKEDIVKENFLIMSQHQDENVRTIIAFNGNIPLDILLRLASDPSDLVVQGVIGNPLLSKEIIAVLSKNPVALKHLVRSPRVPQETILQIYKQHREVSLVSFASNPNCPEEIKADIRKSRDYNAKNTLDQNEKMVVKI